MILMIPYHVTPIGGPAAQVSRFLTGRHALIPWPRQDDLALAADVCRSFVFDNGAFSAWKRGIPIDFDAYVAWVQIWQHHPGFDWALIPDVINGDEQANDALVERWLDEVPKPALCGVPVWHLHESLDRLQKLAESWPQVALGSSGKWATPGTAAWWVRMSEALDAVCVDGKPPCKLHGLRMLSIKIFPRLPLSSADSSNAAVNSGSTERFGIYKPPTRHQRAEVIAARIEAHNSAPFWFSETASA